MIFSKFLNATNWHKRPYTEILDEVREITDYLDQNSNFRQVWLSEHHLQTTNNWTMECIPNPILLGPVKLDWVYTPLSNYLSFVSDVHSTTLV